MERLLSVEEVADVLHIDAGTVRRLVRRGELPAVRIGRLWRFKPSALDKLLVSADSPAIHG